MMDDLDFIATTSLEQVLGGATARKVQQAFGYETVGQMLGHFPRRYMEIGELSKISELPIGEEVTIVAQVESINQRRMHSRSGFLLQVAVRDAIGPGAVDAQDDLLQRVRGKAGPASRCNRNVQRQGDATTKTTWN